MIDIQAFIKEFLQKLQGTFKDRVWFVGLQGSYGRGEATDTSDIDMVVILEDLTPSDIMLYGQMLDTLPAREHLCGFFAGKNELLHWDAADLFQLYHDTTPIIGSLDALLPLLDAEAACRAVKIGACNIFHSCVHNMLYEKSAEILRGLYKSACFVVQAMVYLQTGNYYKKQIDLSSAAAPKERVIVDTYLALKKGAAVDLDAHSQQILVWVQGVIDA